MRRALFILSILTGFFTQVQARTISFQGYFSDTTYSAVDVEVLLYEDSTGSSPIWQDSFTQVPLKTKTFTVILGSKKSLSSIDFSKDLWFRTSINQRNSSIYKVSSVPHSFQSWSLKGIIKQGSTVEPGILVQSVNGLKDSVSITPGQGIVINTDSSGIHIGLDSTITAKSTKLEISANCTVEQRNAGGFGAFYTCVDPLTNEVFIVGEDLNFINLGTLAFSTEDRHGWDSAYTHSRTDSLHFSSNSTKTAAERNADSTQSGLLSSEDWSIFNEHGDLIEDLDSLLDSTSLRAGIAYSQSIENHSTLSNHSQQLSSVRDYKLTVNYTENKLVSERHLQVDSNLYVGGTLTVDHINWDTPRQTLPAFLGDSLRIVYDATDDENPITNFPIDANWAELGKYQNTHYEWYAEPPKFVPRSTSCLSGNNPSKTFDISGFTRGRYALTISKQFGNPGFENNQYAIVEWIEYNGKNRVYATFFIGKLGDISDPNAEASWNLISLYGHENFITDFQCN